MITRKLFSVLILVFMFLGLGCSQAGNDYISPNIGTLKYVPAGTFQRDADKKNTSTVSAFRMSEKEITREQFKRIMGYDPSDTQRSSGKTDPVQNVSWYAALVFCNKLSMLEGLTPVYTINDSTDPARWGTIPTQDRRATWDAVTANWDVNGYRLPTEMEWMWAAMGARDASWGYLKEFAGSNWENIIDDYAWYKSNSEESTHPVGTKKPNELGLYDMSGNVWEWCWDRHNNYPSGSTTNYRGAASGDFRVRRGGSSFYKASYERVAYRFDYRPYNLVADSGFRVVRGN